MSSLLCSVVDTGITNAYGSATEGWYATMMAQGDFRQDVSTHQSSQNSNSYVIEEEHRNRTGAYALNCAFSLARITFPCVNRT